MACVSVDRVKGKVELSLRLSQVDPEAAKRQRQKLGKRRKEGKSRQMLSSDGEEVPADVK